MSFSRLLTQTVAVVRMGAGTADEFGDRNQAETSRSDVKGRLEQTAASEIAVGRDTRLSNWLLFLPADVVIDASDRVEADGQVFEVLGKPDVVRTPRGPHHIEARLQLIEG